MKRFLTLGMVFASTAGLIAREPVSVHPPVVNTSGLNQPLPSAIQSAVPATAPSPLLSSSPSWLPGTLVPASQSIPTVGPSYLSTTPTTTECADCTATGVRPHYNLLSPPRWLSARSECGTCEQRGSLWERFKAWAGYHPCDGEWRRSAVGYRAPLRAYTAQTTCPIGGCNIPTCNTGTCAPPQRVGLLSGLHGGKQSCDVTIPVNPLPTATDTCTTCRPRVVYVPLSTRTDVQPTYGCNETKPCRPSLLRRLVSFVTGDSPCGDSNGCASGCASGECPPPPPSPVHYAAPCAPPTATLRYVRPMPPVTDPTPMAVPTTVPPTPTTSNGKSISTTVPAGKTGQRTSSATQPFTNP